LKKIITMVAVGLMAASISFAKASLTFGIAAQTGSSAGTLLYNGSTITGSNIVLDTITALGTLHDGSYHVTGGLLNFTTGSINNTMTYDSASDSIGFLAPTVFQANFLAGGTFNLHIGSITGVPTTLPHPTTLESGNLGHFSYDPEATSDTGSGSVTSMDSLMQQYFGFPATTTWNFSLTSLDTTVQYYDAAGHLIGAGTTNGTEVKTFTAQVNGGSFQDKTLASAVPEPASILLFSGMLLGVASIARRRLHKQV
jgi:hypothetical protein